MANHIQNRIKINCNEEQLKNILESIKGENYEDGTPMKIDFNKIIPMPKELHIDSDVWLMPIEHYPYPNPDADTGIMAHLKEMKLHLDKNPSRKEKDINNFLQGIKNYLNFGYATWYKWSTYNWGTKWNAYQQGDKRDTNNIIYFQTAWSTPIPVIKQLSKMFPIVEITLDYADEDSGSNAGQIMFFNGEIVNHYEPKSQSIEAYNIYFELHPDEKENYALVDGKYEYVELD